MPDIKLIGLDLDGTLLTTTKELTENTKKVLTKPEKSRYNSVLSKQNAQAYDAVRLHTDILHEI